MMFPAIEEIDMKKTTQYDFVVECEGVGREGVVSYRHKRKKVRARSVKQEEVYVPHPLPPGAGR